MHRGQDDMSSISNFLSCCFNNNNNNNASRHRKNKNRCCLEKVKSATSVNNYDQDNVADWIHHVWWSLKLDDFRFNNKPHHYSKEVKKNLLLQEKKDKSIIDGSDDFDNYYYNENLDHSTDIDADTDTDADADANADADELNWIVQGLPRRPYYKELALRLYRWNRRYYHCKGSSSSSSSSLSSSSYLIVPAESIGLREIIANNRHMMDCIEAKSDDERLSPLQRPPKTVNEIRLWLSQIGDEGIYRLLGIRNTIGSIHPIEKRLMMIPSRKSLMDAADCIHERKTVSSSNKSGKKSKSSTKSNNKNNHNVEQLLTVAARARSKHSHRAIKDSSFFGTTITGNPSKQNKETRIILHRLLNECIWINCHTFGGLSLKNNSNNNNKNNNNNQKTKNASSLSLSSASLASSSSSNYKKKTVNHNDDNNSDKNEESESWVLEIRQREGYGARWLIMQLPPQTTASSRKNSCYDQNSSLVQVVQFRGFLEPQMVDGHEKGWRH
jgi:hypothetical protein